MARVELQLKILLALCAPYEAGDVPVASVRINDYGDHTLGVLVVRTEIVG